MRDSRADCTG